MLELRFAAVEPAADLRAGQVDRAVVARPRGPRPPEQQVTFDAEAVGAQRGTGRVGQHRVDEAELAADARAQQADRRVLARSGRLRPLEEHAAVDPDAVGGQRGTRVVDDPRVLTAELAADVRAEQADRGGLPGPTRPHPPQEQVVVDPEVVGTQRGTRVVDEQRVLAAEQAADLSAQQADPARPHPVQHDVAVDPDAIRLHGRCAAAAQHQAGEGRAHGRDAARDDAADQLQAHRSSNVVQVEVPGDPRAAHPESAWIELAASSEQEFADHFRADGVPGIVVDGQVVDGQVTAHQLDAAPCRVDEFSLAVGEVVEHGYRGFRCHTR